MFTSIWKLYFLAILQLTVRCFEPEIVFPLGRIKGHILKTENGKNFAAFQGIPYAQPPIGELRFEEPRPAIAWKDTLTANEIKKCIQYNHYTLPGDDYVIGEEDCLYVNVYTPIKNSIKKYNVIIYIHGGAFMFNHGGSYGPKIILDHDIIYVTFNYRLGPMGFLSTEDSIVPGNNGLKDQLAALKWVKKYINYFGGNENSITLTGMSAGGASTQLHALSLLSKGLFTRGISQSGAALNPWVMMENSLIKCKQLAAHLKCSTKSTEDMIECLKGKRAYDIVKAVKLFQPWLYNPFSPFGVVIDKWSTNPFLPKHPYQLLKERKVQDVPWIFSNVESEGLYPAADFIANPSYLDEIHNEWNELIPHILHFNETLSLKDQLVVLQKIRDFYFQDKPVCESTFASLVKMISDRLFIADIEESAKLHSAAIQSPVYYYYFSYRGQHSKSQVRSGSNTNYGAAHADDTTYILSTDINTHTTEEDKSMSKIMVDMWLSYANSSIPLVEDVEWIPVSKTATDFLSYILIDSPNAISLKSSSDIGNKHFWYSLPLQENQNIFEIKDEL